MFVATLLKLVFILPPTLVIAVMAATAISEAINPYSIAVAPFVLRNISIILRTLTEKWGMSLLHLYSIFTRRAANKVRRPACVVIL